MRDATYIDYFKRAREHLQPGLPFVKRLQESQKVKNLKMQNINKSLFQMATLATTYWQIEKT